METAGDRAMVASLYCRVLGLLLWCISIVRSGWVLECWRCTTLLVCVFSADVCSIFVYGLYDRVPDAIRRLQSSLEGLTNKCLLIEAVDEFILKQDADVYVSTWILIDNNQDLKKIVAYVHLHLQILLHLFSEEISRQMLKIWILPQIYLNLLVTPMSTCDTG